MSRPASMLIDLNALHHNYAQVKHFAPHQKIIAMVKANAYGHGLTRVAKALPMADAFGVAALDEGIMLREAGITQPIILMEGLFNEKEIEEATRYKFDLVIHHEAHVAMLENWHGKGFFSVWLKINTGMNRLGVPLTQVDSIYSRLSALAVVTKPISLMTHFAQADSQDSKFTELQMKSFNQAVSRFKGPKSLANSAAVLMHPNAHADWVRPGLMLYGGSPILGKTGKDFNLKPVMTLSSEIIAINHLKRGDVVGYGCTFEAREIMRIGVVAIGYGDGYPQFAANGTPVLVNNKDCTLVGRVSMDMLTVDLTYLPEVSIGDPVTLWGEGLPVERVAKSCETSTYEILTRMTPRPKLEIKG